MPQAGRDGEPGDRSGVEGSLRGKRAEDLGMLAIVFAEVCQEPDR
jgi:hypothetical protein